MTVGVDASTIKPLGYLFLWAFTTVLYMGFSALARFHDNTRQRTKQKLCLWSGYVFVGCGCLFAIYVPLFEDAEHALGFGLCFGAFLASFGVGLIYLSPHVS